jgi:hypothetical protein
VHIASFRGWRARVDVVVLFERTRAVMPRRRSARRETWRTGSPMDRSVARRLRRFSRTFADVTTRGAVDLWLDEKRVAPRGWTHVRTVGDAQRLLRSGRVEHASLDYTRMGTA